MYLRQLVGTLTGASNLAIASDSQEPISTWTWPIFISLCFPPHTTIYRVVHVSGWVYEAVRMLFQRWLSAPANLQILFSAYQREPGYIESRYIEKVSGRVKRSHRATTPRDPSSLRGPPQRPRLRWPEKLRDLAPYLSLQIGQSNYHTTKKKCRRLLL